MTSYYLSPISFISPLTYYTALPPRCIPPCHRPLLTSPPGLLALTALVRPACWPSLPRLVGHTCLAVTSSRDSHSRLGNKRHQPEASCFRSKQLPLVVNKMKRKPRKLQFTISPPCFRVHKKSMATISARGKILRVQPKLAVNRLKVLTTQMKRILILSFPYVV